MISQIFKVLGDPMRRNILQELKKGRLNAGEIADRFSLTPPAMSYHLRLLKEADLVMEYKVKNYVYYELNTNVFQEIYLWIKQIGGDQDEK